MGTQSVFATMVSRAADLEYRLHNSLRPSAAFDAARKPSITQDLSVLDRTSTCLLVTYRANGEPVPSPVFFGIASGKVYLRSESRTAKLRRIAANPTVLVGPCSFRGAPRGPFLRGTARVVSPSEEAAAYAALQTNYRWLDRLYERTADRLPIDPAYVEIRCD